ncbi:MAG: anti-sigma factor antagonist [Ruthenibacterium lactatiformans]
MTQVTLKQDGKTLTALLSGEIDHHWAAILREKIDERAAAAAPAILILDFSAVTFMDSSGIGLILGRHKLISAMGGVVVVQKAPKDIKRSCPSRASNPTGPRAKRVITNESTEYGKDHIPQPQRERGLCPQRALGICRAGGPYAGRAGRR